MTTYFSYETNTFRLKSLQTTKTGGSVYQNLEYAYDNVGNVSSITDFLTSANSQTLTYDDLNRLLTATTSAYGTLTYTYNQIGNMLSNSQVGTYTYPASGASSVRPHAVTTAGSNSYTYDANGNMLTGAGRTLTYDDENRPTTIVSGGQTTTFVYDGDGGRVKKQTGSTVTWYISKLYECDGRACTKMIFSGDKRIVAKPVGSSSLYFYHGDHLGSTSVVTDVNGNNVEALTYYPFGQTRTNVPGTPVNVAHKYTGKELDNATGLYWYEWRSYDPILARFLVPDTIVPSPQDPQGLNRYSYVTNNPLRYTDPTGHFRLNVSKFLRTSLGPIGSQIVIAAVAITAAYFTAGAASSAFLGAFNVAVGPPTLAMATAASAVGGVAGGVVGGGLAGGLQGENFNRALSGAIGGGLSGGVFGGLGPLTSGWDYAAKAATYGTAGGASSAARGGSFTRGLVSSLAVSTLTSAALQMRADMIEQSRLNQANAGGESEGFNGDRFKLGGVRWVEGVDPKDQPAGLLFGGQQRDQGYLFGIPYSPGSFADRLVETFAGPHDFMNSFTWYNEQGNALPLTGFSAAFGEALNAANVFLAAPFAAASVIPEYAYPLLGRR